MSKILIYCPLITNRLKYATAFVFNQMDNHEVLCTDNIEQFLTDKAEKKINYSHESLPGHAVFNSGFLGETGVSADFIPDSAGAESSYRLFTEPNGRGFDLFAMVFWCLSRYEEYQPFSPDKYGRFAATNSLLHRDNVLDFPVLDIAVNEFLEQSGLQPVKEFRIIPTIDVDIALAYGARPFWRQAGSAIRQLLKNPAGIAERWKALQNIQLDPNNAFSYIEDKLAQNLNSRIFWHCGYENTKMDKQVMLENPNVSAIIHHISSHIEPGIHPSSVAFSNGNTLVKEKKRLTKLSNKNISDSRQHFILLRFPNTYRGLINAGITRDYSMGYPDACGFRAGTAKPFKWFDLKTDTATNLEIMPFCAMDVTCKDYMKLNINEAIDKGQALKSIIKQNGGVFSFIFHNESLGEQPQWKGWKEVFESWLK